MKRSRPGEIVTAWRDDDDGHTEALAVVTATSVHAATINEPLARRLLALGVLEDWPAERDTAKGYPFGREEAAALLIPFLAEHAVAITWRSVTRTEIVQGTHDCAGECDEGGWCESGAGQAWTTALVIGTARAERFLDGAVFHAIESLTKASS